MTKVAVYGFVRIVFDLLGTAGLVVEHAGARRRRRHRGARRALCADAAAISSACSPTARSRISASSSSALGLALAFQANGMTAAAALALTAALLHVFNHSLFKSLLFFGAGAVLHATGERDMERLGGLIHRMPQTAFVFLVGCVAISALPPLNGFVSEWLTFQAILLSPQLPSLGPEVPGAGGRRAAGAVGGAGRRLFRQGLRHDVPRAAALARRPNARMRSTASRSPRCSRSPRSAWSPAFCPACSSTRWRRSCRRWSAPACRSQTGVALAVDRADRREPQFLQRPAGVRVHRAVRHAGGLRDSSARLGPAAARAGLGLRLSRCLARSRSTRADSFAQPIRRVFGTMVFRAREHVDMPPPGDMRPARLTVESRDLDLGHALCADRRWRR